MPVKWQIYSNTPRAKMSKLVTKAELQTYKNIHTHLKPSLFTSSPPMLFLKEEETRPPASQPVTVQSMKYNYMTSMRRGVLTYNQKNDVDI